MRFLPHLILLTAVFAGTAHAQQPAIGVPPSLEVQRLAPQLVNFFGSSANFQNLVNGLASGTPITLTSVGADGLTRVVTFTPGSTLPPLQIAQTLESARQALISRGIATPSAEQTAVTLVGGNLQTATGIVPTTALVPTTSTPPVASTSASRGTGSAAAGGTVPSPAITVQQQSTPTGPTTSGNTSDSLRTRPISDSPPTPLPSTPAGTPDSTITATPAPAASAPLARTTPGTTALPGGAVATPPATTTATGTPTPPSSASTPSAIRR